MAAQSTKLILSDYKNATNLFGFARNFALLFDKLKKKYISASNLLNTYAQHFKKCLSMKKDFNAHSGDQMMDEKLPIFDIVKIDGPAKRKVKLNKQKLIDFLFIPVLKAQNGKLNRHVVPRKFQEVTGISSDFLLHIFDWSKFPDLAALVCDVSPGNFVLDESQDLVLLSQASPKLVTTTQSESGKHRVRTESSTEPQPLPCQPPGKDYSSSSQELDQEEMSWAPSPQATTPKRTLLPHPIRPPSHYPQPMVPERVPPRMPIPSQPHLMGPPVRMHAPLYYQPRAPHQPSPPPTVIDLTRDSESSPSPRQQHPVEKFPNPQTEVEAETLLPSHELFRPELSRQPMPANKLSTSSKRRSDKSQNPLEAINSKLEEIVEELSSKGKFVPVDYVRKIMRDILQQENARRPYNSRINWRDVKFMEYYSKVHGRVEELIKIFCLFNSNTTLYELEQALILTENVQSFEELHIGPLHKHPKVKDFFKPPENLTEIPKITGFMLRKHLMNFLTRRHKGTKSSLEDFLEFVRAKEFAESIFHLCIRVSSFPLAIQMNFKFIRAQRESQKRTNMEIEAEMLKLVQYEAERLKRKLSSQSEDSIRRELAGKNPVEILTAIFNVCQKYFAGPIKRRVDDFLMTFTGNPRLQNLLLLAIYEGAYDAEKHMVRLFGEERSQDRNTGTSIQAEIYHRSRSEVLKEMTAQLTRIPFPIDLASLARVETYLAEKFDAPNFDSLGNGSFLNFIASHSELTSALGGGQIGASSSSERSLALRQRLLSFVRQLASEHKEEDTVSSVICTHFNVESFQDLGCGTISKLIADSQLAPQQSFPIKFLDPLLTNEANLDTSRVGLLGHQTASDALSCLKKAPLLEDLKVWSHWDLLYRPQFGELESFLETHPGVCALQVAPGQLLRINPDSTVSDFINALEFFDSIRASGHLVSLVVQRGGVKNISPQLLASHVTSSLEKKLASSEESVSGVEEATEFIHDTLVRIPLKMCVNIANEIFLEPLRQVATSSSVSDILTHCRHSQHRLFFQSLGLSIGIKPWTDDFGTMLEEVDKQTAYHSTTQQQDVKEQTESSPVESHNGKYPVSSDSPSMEETWPAEAEDSTEDEMDSSELTENTEDRTVHREHCREIIESIRHDNFGIGVVLDEQQQLVAKKQREREGRGLKRLSSELYTKDTHFVLELIQNADDNSYPSKGVTPSLVFVISETAITVLNNEVGFSEKNIRAICDVGKSTKGVHRSGYIGQKGIGFKSVFRVSNTPEIHSNGFHIRFDASADPIGFILPNWVEEPPTGETDPKWTTRVTLPLKVDHLSTNMVKKFKDIQPSLLLFLHRLRSISIKDQVTGNVRQMVRSDKDRGVIEIGHMDGAAGGSVDRWLVVRRVLDKAKQFKPDVEATELAIAFPLPSSVSDIPLSKDLQHQQVFAFLPLRSYGFRFILQGDFDLPSSREDVNSDSPWNQWLREEVPSLFLESLQRIKELRGISEMDAVSLFLQFIPLEGELHDFFQPVTRQILNLLRGKDCLPSDPHSHSIKPTSLLSANPELDDTSATISWRQPSQLLIVKEKFSFIRDNIQQALLSQSLNLLYLSSSVLPYINPTLQYQLGIADLSLQHLKEVAETALDIFSKAKQDSEDFLALSSNSEEEEFADSDDSEYVPIKTIHQKFVKWVANWLACVHLIIEDTNDVSVVTAIESLKKLKILPLLNGSLVSSEDSALFFPPDFNKGKEAKESAEYRTILSELQVIDVKLFEEGDELVQSRVRKVLEQLGVKNLYPADIIRHHITPVFVNSSYNRKKRQQRLLSSYLTYIKECIEDRRSGVTESEVVQLLKDHVVLITSKGLKSPSREVIHFSSAYQCNPDLQSLFPNVKWTVVDPVYLKKPINKEDLHFWTRFFVKLGVKRGLHVQRCDEHLAEDCPRLEELRSSMFRRLPPGACTVRDWQSSEFKEIIDSVKKADSDTQSHQMRHLAKLLDENWNEEYAKYMDAKIYDSDNDHFLDINDASTFKRDIVQLAWLPCLQTNPSIKTVLFRGRDLFSGQARQVHSLLSNHVPYLGVELKSSELLSLLGVRIAVSIDQLVEHLKQWVLLSQDKPFVTSIDHMRHVYMHLHSHVLEEQETGVASSSHIQELFQEEKVVFVPNQYVESESATATAGSFYSVHSVCWLDPSTVLYHKQRRNQELPPNLPKLLQLHYSSNDPAKSIRIQQAFEYFGVPPNPRVNAYISLLKHISSLSPTPEPLSVEDFACIAFQFVSIVSSDPRVESFIYNNLTQARVFPAHTGCWVSLEDCLLENDSVKVAKCFRETKDVHFLQWPTKLHKANQYSEKQALENRQQLIDLCKIPRLSVKAVERIAVYGMTVPQDEIKGYLHIWVPLIQRYMVTHCPQTYKQLQDSGIEQMLKRLLCLSVEKLDCRYSIDHGGKFIESSQSTALYCTFTNDTSGVPTLYILESKVERLGVLLPALEKMFMSENSPKEESDSLKDFLQTLINQQPSTLEEIEELASSYELPLLPEDVLVWSIPVAQHQRTAEKSSESEEDSSGGDYYVVDTWPSTEQSELSESNQENTGLKSWPPKAAVERHPTQHPATNLQQQYIPQTGDKTTDTVGTKEYEDIKNKFNLEGTAPPTGELPNTPSAVLPPEHQSRPNYDKHTSVDKHALTGDKESTSDRDPVASTQASEAIDNWSALPPSKKPCPGEAGHGHPTIPDTVLAQRDLERQEHTVTGSEGGTHLDSNSRSVSTSGRKGFFREDVVDSQIGLVPLTELVQSVQPSDGMPIIPLLNSDDPDYLKRIGHWGEEFVFTLLRNSRQFPDGGQIMAITWVNQASESGLPYDLALELDLSKGQERQTCFIDVKATAGKEKELVAASWKELKFAQDNTDSYYIFRVYGAGSSMARVSFVKNMLGYFENNQTRLFFYL